MLLNLFHLILLAVTVSGCKWIDDIQEQIVNFKIEKEGFHRDYLLSTKISSMSRFMDCKLAIKVIIPKGAFVDTVNLDSQLITHCYNSPGIFDVEQPEFSNSTKEQSIFFYSQKPIRKLFIIEDTLKFPIHLRYHAPSDSEAVRIVDFKTPQIFVSCQNNDTIIFNDKNCQRFAKKIPCSCSPSNQKCSYMKLNAQPSSSSSISSMAKVAEVPIGNSTWRKEVMATTFLCIAAVIALLLKEMFYKTSLPLPSKETQRIKKD